MPPHRKNNVCRVCQVLNNQAVNRREKATEKLIQQAREEAYQKASDDLWSSLEVVNEKFPQFVRAQLLVSKNSKAGYQLELLYACLRLWLRDPKAYEDHRAGEFTGRLPGIRVLRGYKNMIEQKSGFLPDFLDWMLEVAQDLGVAGTDGMSGGIAIDGMAIQPDLCLVVRGGELVYVGLPELGGFLTATDLYFGRKRKGLLATEMMQVIFNGITGFKFPLAHFPVTNYDKFDIGFTCMDAVGMLASRGFKTTYMVMDGHPVNRGFMRMMLGKSPQKWTLMDPWSDGSITIFMDPKHTIKKIRNSILPSGVRLITSRRGTIEWKNWRDAYEFNTSQGFFALHPKLTEEHMNPKGSLKMSNHLAEDVLDSNMLRLMKAYQVHLGDKGTHLEATIELLEHMSTLVEFANILVPLHEATYRHQLRSPVLAAVHYIKELGNGRKEKTFTEPTVWDAVSSFEGLDELILRIYKESGLSTVKPGRLNSDVIENHFCMVRGLFGKTNCHPTSYKYSTLQNSVVLTQKVGSVGRHNTGNFIEPYVVSAKKRKVVPSN